MRIKNEYTASLKNAGRYNPDNFTAAGVAALYIVLLALFFSLPYILRIAGMMGILRQIADRDYFLFMVIDALLSQGVIIAAGLIYSAIMRVNPVSGGGYRCKFDFTAMLFGCVLIAGVQICFYTLHMQFSESASSFGVDVGTDGSVMATGNPLFAIIYLILMPVLPCICEELVFRGIIMRGLSRFGGFAAVIISGAMFSLFHGNFQQVILQFIGGVAIGGAVMITKNFAVGMAMHFFNNLFAVGYALMLGLYSLSGPLYNVFTVCTVLIGITMLVVGMWYFIKRMTGGFKGDRLLERPFLPKPVLMSAESRAEYSSIVIDASQIDEFKKFYPDAMRYKRGGFVSLKRERKSPVLAVTLVAIGLTLASVCLILNQFGI